MLVICDGFVLTQLLPAMAFAYTVLLDSVLAQLLTPSSSAVCWGQRLDRFGGEAIQSLAFARNTMSTDSRSLRSIRWL